MIKSNNTINIEGSVIDHDELREYLSFDGNDAKTKWLIKPLIVISGIGLAVAALFASVFLMAVSLVMVPVLGIAMWAMKSNIQKAVNQRAASAETPVSTGDDTDTGTPDPA